MEAIISYDSAQEALELVARDALYVLIAELRHMRKEYWPAVKEDGGAKFIQVEFKVPDVSLIAMMPAYQEVYMQAALKKMAADICASAPSSRAILVAQRMPICEWEGFGRYAETYDFGAHVVMRYNPVSLTQVFEVNVLYRFKTDEL